LYEQAGGSVLYAHEPTTHGSVVVVGAVVVGAVVVVVVIHTMFAPE
jgi:hypothetical protein